jgi:hypothetical protein
MSGVVAVLASLPVCGVIAVIALSGFLLKSPDAPDMDGPQVAIPVETAGSAMISLPEATAVPGRSVERGMIAP